MNLEQYKAMEDKAELMLTAIEDDDVDGMIAAIEIDCIFCREYMKFVTQFKVGDPNGRCDNCPMFNADLCAFSYDDDNPFRIVDKYFTSKIERISSDITKEEAKNAAKKLFVGILKLSEEAFGEKLALALKTEGIEPVSENHG